MKRLCNGTSEMASTTTGLLICVLTIFSLFVTATAHAAEGRRMLWQSREQFVAIEKEGGGRSVSKNDHPAAITPAQLRSILQSLVTGKPDQRVPLFREAELEILSSRLTAALGQARPEEDVTFAVIGLFPVLAGLVKEPRVTTGRVFVEKGRLNIIFGAVQGDYKENEDRRLNPLPLGSRNTAAYPAAELAAPAASRSFSTKRNDWVEFFIGDSVEMPASSAKEEQLAPLVQKQGVQEKKPGRTLKERLMLLDELRGASLITEEEYRAKRSKILEEL
jgi:hypothetical protein